MKTLSDHILDIVQNSIHAKATLIEIMVEESKKNDLCVVTVRDNGCGMDEETLKQAANPFFTTRRTRKVGLGLSLLRQNAERANGNFSIESVLEKGTTVKASFQFSNLDKPELGEVWDIFYLTMLGNKNIEFSYEHTTDIGDFVIKSSDIRVMTNGVSIQQNQIRKAISELMKNNINDIQEINNQYINYD